MELPESDYNYNKGVIHLLPLLLVAVVIIAVGAFLIFGKGRLKITSIGKKEPKVSVNTEYKNPFKKQTQFVNPFDQYKSPFLTLQKK